MIDKNKLIQALHDECKKDIYKEVPAWILKVIESQPHLEINKRKIERSIERGKKKIEDLRELNLSAAGQWSLGYYEGRLSVLEELLDELEE